MNPLPSYTHLILSGGGMSGLSYVGIYRYLKQFSMLNSIRYLIGCSVGAMFAFLFALNLEVEELETAIQEFVSNELVNTFHPDQILNILDNKGIYSTERYSIFLKNLLRKIYQIDTVTLQEFAKLTGKNIFISVTCLNDIENKFLSNISTPDIDIFSALQAAIAIPGIFQPIQIGDSIYIDGGVSTSIPIRCLSYNETDKLLILSLSQDNKKDSEYLKDAYNYSIQLLETILYSKNIELLKEYKHKKNIDVISLDNNPISFFPLYVHDSTIKMNVTLQDLDKAIMYGYQLIYHYIKKKYCTTL